MLPYWVSPGHRRHSAWGTPTPIIPTMKKALRWIGRGLAAIVALLALGIGSVYALTSRRMARTFEVPREHELAVASDSATIERGKYLAVTRGCTDCHGPNLGGRVLVEDPAIGRLVTANLTSGRKGGALDARGFELAVRHGIRPDGSALLVMPSQEFQGFTDDDVAAMAAYARSLPAVSDPLPTMKIGPLARVLWMAGKLQAVPAEDVKPVSQHVVTLAMADTKEYGSYVAAGCVGCHGMDYSGGPIAGMPPGTPPAANITPDSATGIGAWTEEQFVTALRTGLRPDGSKIAPPMPIEATKLMVDEEIRATYKYLRTVAAKQTVKR